MSIPTPSCVRVLVRQRTRRSALAGFCVLACVLALGGAGSPFAAEPPQRPLQEQLEALLEQQGIKPEYAALLLYSTTARKYLAAARQDQPLIAASNTKLVTTYVALRVLGPNYRWRTRLSLVEPNDVPGGTGRQGLLIEGSGDPTLTSRGLEAMALRLKAEGVRRIEGPIYLDASLYEEEARPNPLPPESPAYIPLSPFVLDANLVEFTVTRGANGTPDVLALLPPEGARIVNQVQAVTEGRSTIKLQQTWGERGVTFTLSGDVRTTPRVHTVSTAVSQPGPWFYHGFRAAMRRVGIEGNPPLHLGAPENATSRLLFSHLSPPLREAIVEIDKQSSNLGAEAMLRAVAQTIKPKAVGGDDGMRIVRRELAKEFPGMEAHYRLADGSGISRNNQLSPLFLVRLLNRVLSDGTLRTEFLSALPVVGWDGTLRYRGASTQIDGRVRAKTGTLNGVSNLAGYLSTDDDTIVFAFLINDPTRPVEQSQSAQDQVMAGLLEALNTPPVAEAAPPPPPLVKTEPKAPPKVVAAPVAPPIAEPAKAEAAPPPKAAVPEPAILPPPASAKPKREKKG